MGFNNYTQAGNISSYNMYSTTPTATVADGVQGTPYTVGQLTGALGSTSFVIAIDVNTTGAAGETLLLFEVIINGAVAYDYIGPTDIGDVNNNWQRLCGLDIGHGEPGSLLRSTVLFHAVWNNASDGAESFLWCQRPPSQPRKPRRCS
jgi:hypothetical protein